ncbi:hypothetical protein GB937_010885, partial [Aspergillus fischeri]
IKVITLFRVFTNQETTDGYYLLFRRVFSLIQKITGEPVNILASDAFFKRLTLSTAQFWQLKGIIIFCRVHFLRTITEAVGNNNKGSGIWSRMAGLIDCKSEGDYDQLCDLLITHEEPKVQTWAEHKRQPVIKASLNKCCSNIPSSIYDSIQNHTNSAEQSHHKANAAGKRLTLVRAIQNSAKLDKQDVLQYINQTCFGIHHSYRTANMEVNYLRHMARE